MLVTPLTKRALALRKEKFRLEALGFRRHETDWEIHRGFRQNELIAEARVSLDGKHVYTRLEEVG